MSKLSGVFLVDDDQTTNYLNQLLLRRSGVECPISVALNGREALDLLQERHEQAATEDDAPILLLLDVKMPVMDGFEFLAAYAELPPALRQSVVIVMLTTSLHPLDLGRAQKLDVAGFLNKPLSKEKIHDLLQAHFQGQSA